MKAAEPRKSTIKSDDSGTYNFSNYDKYTNDFSIKTRTYELVETTFNKSKSVKGRLKDHIQFWKDVIQPENDILNILEYGYSIPFTVHPPSYQMKNNKSALNNREFVDQAVKDLIGKNCVYEVSVKPHNISPLSVAENSSGKKRLMLDLSVLNNYVKTE